MRDPERIDTYLEAIREIWKQNPDLRFTQLIMNVIPQEFGYYLEDQESISQLRNYYGLPTIELPKRK